MFAKDTKRSFQLSTTPSFLPNNLSSSVHESLVLGRINDVHIFRTSGEPTRVPISKCKLFQATFVEVQRNSVLVTLSDNGLQVWSEDGDSMIYHYPLASAIPTEPEEGKYLRGTHGQGNDIFVGCSSGNVLVFDCSAGLKSGQFSLLHTLECNQIPISAISSSKSWLAVGDDFGNVYLYDIKDAYRQATVFKGCGIPCTSIAVTDNVVIAGYSTGHIRMFRTDIHELAVEITAHTRAVTGLALQESSQLLVSVGSDSFAHVWSIPRFQSKSDGNVGCVFSDYLENKMCTGVAWLGEQRFAVANYDDDELVVYVRH